MFVCQAVIVQILALSWAWTRGAKAWLSRAPLGHIAAIAVGSALCSLLPLIALSPALKDVEIRPGDLTSIPLLLWMLTGPAVSTLVLMRFVDRSHHGPVR